MKITDEEIKSNEEILAQLDHISDEELEKDLKETEQELKGFEEEHSILWQNPPENKLQLYFLEGKIQERRNLIKRLNAIKDFRKNRGK